MSDWSSDVCSSDLRFGAHADAYLKVYPGADPKADVMASIRDGLYGWAAQYVVRQQAATGQKAYLYYFRHSPPAQRARDLAAFHASELPYVFGQVGASAVLGPNWPRPPLTAAESPEPKTVVWGNSVSYTVELGERRNT